MRRIASLVLTIALVIAAIPTAFAYVPGGNLCIAQHDGSEEYSGIECCAICDWCPVCEGDCDCLAPVDYSVGTQVVFQANGTESYTITVPALLTPGQSGTVTLEGTWAENRVVTVTADPTVTLTNSLLETDTKTLNINFNGGLSEAGSNIDSLKFTQQIAVGNIENALFGTWSGKFNYNVEIDDGVAFISFTIDGKANNAGLPVITESLAVGTTWNDYLETNEDFGLMGNGYVHYQGNLLLSETGGHVKGTDEIIDGHTYVCDMSSED